MIEDIIIDALNKDSGEYGEGVFIKSATIINDEYSVEACAVWGTHDEEDWQTFDWGRSKVQTSTEIDELRELEIFCYRNEDDEPIDLDYDYIERELCA